MKPYFFFALCTAALSVNTLAFTDESADKALFDLSLEELIALEVTSVSRKKQRLMDSAAAIYVITQEDIRRSGVTTIPDALRMVPGMQVAQMNSNTWSVSARGFNYIFANKLLVLMDGRTLYTPLFSGVNWDIQDTLLEDIDRIEVIRGPGAALWGANAVNGVINIITKTAADTQGTLLTVRGGNKEKGGGHFRHGGQLNDQAYYRVYYKSFLKDGFANSDGSDAADDWKIDRFGFRVDWQAGQDEVTFQGDVYTGSTRPPLRLLDTLQSTPTIVTLTDQPREQQGGNIITRWHKKISDVSEFSLKAFYDRYESNDYRINTLRDTIDLEMQHRYQWRDNQELIWGLGYRTTWYDLSDMNYVVVQNSRPHEELYSGFLQDEIRLTADWHVTLSARLEHHTATGSEFQPNARIAWSPDSVSTVWASVSKAVRTPAITERDFAVNTAIPASNPSLPANTFQRITGNPAIKSEQLTAFELGYRRQIHETFSIDIATFVNQYDDLVSLTQSSNCPANTTFNSGICAAGTYFLLPAGLTNGLDAKTYGVELTTDWEATHWWRLKADVAFLQVDATSHQNQPFSKQTEALVEGLSAQYTANLRSMMNLPNQWFLATWIRYVDNNRSAGASAYTSLNVKASHQLAPDLELAIVGQNLFDRQRLEFNEQFTGLAATEVQESWYAQIQWQF